MLRLTAFLSELKHRRVFRVAVVYLGAAFVALEAVDILAPALRLPDWTTLFVFFLLLVGFPVALILAWTFDLTLEGLVRTPPSDHLARPNDKTKRPAKPLTGNRALVASGLLILVAIAAILIYRQTVPIYGEVPSIGVLYLENLGAEEDEFFSYGITEDIIIDLTKAGLIRVPTMKDILPFREGEMSISEIANALRVQFILTGSFRREAEHFRFAAQLVEPSTGRNIWSDRWEEPLSEIPAIKGKIIHEVTGNLGITPTTIAIQEIEGKPTPNLNAYEFYLKGKYRYDHREDLEDLDVARGLLEKAIELDPDFVSPRTKLGESYREAGEFNRALAAYEKALAISREKRNLSGEALALRGISGIYWARGEYDQAIELSVRSLEAFQHVGDHAGQASALSNIGIFHYIYGDYDEALDHYGRALQIDRDLGDRFGEGIRLNNIGVVHKDLGNNDKAMKSFSSLLKISKELDRPYTEAFAHEGIGEVHFFNGKYSVAAKQLKMAIDIYESVGANTAILEPLSYLALCNAKMDNKNTALEMAQMLEERYSIVETAGLPLIILWNTAQVFTLIGRPEEARTYHERAYNEVMRQANNIQSDEGRQAFLTQMTQNRAIVQGWEQMEKPH